VTTRWEIADKKAAIQRACLYLCTPIRQDLTHFVASCIAGGVDVVQLREKDATDKEIYEAGARLSDLCRDARIPFFINDRFDLALACGADGVHLGQDDLPPNAVAPEIRRSLLLGYSTHTPAELDASELMDLDYISVGPIEATPTKPGRPGTGVDYLRYAAAKTKRPFFVTGGVSPKTLDQLLANGAQRFVVVRALTEASHPQEVAMTLRSTIRQRHEGDRETF
jgi:thiamine-phosphate pyrophosphorylase